jgi:hypothetical protein
MDRLAEAQVSAHGVLVDALEQTCTEQLLKKGARRFD